MKLVYVAGPYRAKTEWELEENIRRAEALALDLWREGIAVICPHKNTAHFGGAADDGAWLLGDLEMMRRCDAVVVTSHFEGSTGTLAEIQDAGSRGIPVVYRDDEHWWEKLSNALYYGTS